MSHISAHRTDNYVVWRMTAWEARDVARFLEDKTSDRDLARVDARHLREAADRLDPQEQEQQ